MKPPNDMARVVRNASIQTNGAVNERVLQKIQDAYANSAGATVEGRAGGRRAVVAGRLTRWAVAALLVLAVGALVAHLARPLGSTVAWAEVAQQFRSVPFFQAAIYFRESAIAEPRQMELWWSRDGRARIRFGRQVVFARDGRILRTYDIQTHQPVEPDEPVAAFLGKIAQTREFSLETIINLMFGGKARDVTPLVNPDAAISQDLVVFDVDLPGTPEWVRIWALRESRLPVRIRMWNPVDGAATDAVFEYAQGQPDAFFDPDAFADLLGRQSDSSRVNIAYAFLQDPGGRNITPEEMFQQSGYHMPTIRQAGMTEEGAFWVLAGRSRNQMPNGNVFYGFARAQDDLDRTYVRVTGGHRRQDDTSLDVFVPLDYPFDQRHPARIVLICETRETEPREPAELIGTVDLTQWEPNAPRPELWPGGSHDDVTLKIILAQKLRGPEHTGRLTRLLETIPSWTTQPQRPQTLLFWMDMARQRKDFQEAVRIGTVLTPLLLAQPQNQSRHAFNGHVVALAATGRRAEAAALFARLKDIDELTPKRSDERYYGTYQEILARALSDEAKLAVDQISEILGFDISAPGKYPWAAEQAVLAQRSRSWEQHLAELARHYQTHPLPEPMEIRAHTGTENYVLARNEMPGIPGYRVSLLRTELTNYALYYHQRPELAGRIRLEGDTDTTKLNHDLVFKSDTPELQRWTFVLNHFGCEVVEVREPRRIWVVHYDGRALKPYHQVRAPRPPDGQPRPGPGVAVGWGRFSLATLFQSFNNVQNRHRDARGLLILDETGIKSVPDTPGADASVAVSAELPNWEGEEAPALARQWFQEQFGITFTEETRTLTTYVVRVRHR